MARDAIAAVEVIDRGPGYLDRSAGGRKAWKIAKMGGGPKPRHGHAMVAFEPLLDIESLIGERFARQANALLEAGEIEDSTVPGIARIVSNGVAVGEKAVALVDVTRRPDTVEKFLDEALS